jgi:hypothetical protein
MVGKKKAILRQQNGYGIRLGSLGFGQFFFFDLGTAVDQFFQEIGNFFHGSIHAGVFGRSEKVDVFATGDQKSNGFDGYAGSDDRSFTLTGVFGASAFAATGSKAHAGPDDGYAGKLTQRELLPDDGFGVGFVVDELRYLG